MQLSTNSNKQLEWLVNGEPTPIGRHRIAYLQWMEKVRALHKSEFELKRAAAEQEIKEAELALELGNAHRAMESGDTAAARYFEAKAKLKRVEIEELNEGLEWIDMQRQDAQREANVCKSLMEEACNEAGINFEDVDEETYQQLMAENVKLLTGRRLSAQLLESVTGVRASIVELLAEVGESERQDMFSQYLYLLGMFEDSTNGILNPVMSQKHRELVNAD